MSDPEERLSHVDAAGRIRMVDVGEKAVTERECVARGAVRMAAATLAAIADNAGPKGDVLTTARIAAIQAAKRTHEWIPLAHPLMLDVVEIDLQPDADLPGIRIEARVRAKGRTGVEMEAMVAVAAAGLTVYDMCKAIDRGMRIDGVRLASKRGGKSGLWVAPGE